MRLDVLPAAVELEAGVPADAIGGGRGRGRRRSAVVFPTWNSTWQLSQVFEIVAVLPYSIVELAALGAVPTPLGLLSELDRPQLFR